MTFAPPALSEHLRKSTGAYYTPRILVDLLLEHALPLPATPGQVLRIVDPACGAGDFLAPIAQRLGSRAILHGIDLDPRAVAQCHARLDAVNARQPHTPVQFTTSCTDALLDPPPWLADRGFDLVVGNPPFVNAIEHPLSDADKRGLRGRCPNVRGAADRACYFLDQAVRLVRPGGRIALVLPRALLNSPAAAGIRKRLVAHLRPNLIYAPERHDFFPGAAVFICLLILGPAQQCLVSTDPDPRQARFVGGVIEQDNWWLGLQQVLAQQTCGRPIVHARLGDSFELHGSMTAGHAYDLLPHLIDARDAGGQKLVTTGLIEPDACLWGARRCRYLRRDLLHPRISPDALPPPSLEARISKSRRPKILLAGLSRRPECFVDESGQYIGAVSTFSIFHPRDDLALLRRLNDHLLTPQTSQAIIRHLGANALRGAHITLKKAFLQDLPIPAELAADAAQSTTRR